MTAVARPAPISAAIDNQITGAVTQALQAVRTSSNNFIVNDTLWFALNDRNKVTPCVMNSAKFISKKFLDELETAGWTKEKSIIEQTIDAYIEIIPEASEAYRVSPERFLEYFASYTRTAEGASAINEAGGLDHLFTKLYGSLVSRPFVYPGCLPEHLGKYVERTSERLILRVGLEFETGNIASSFRSLYKLGFLYSEREIDAGVFITSIDKNNCAARIWPVSNRNGSFQELRQRNYKRMVVLPLWEFGFAPDGFSNTASFLGSDGHLFTALPSGERLTASDGGEYDVFEGERGKKVLRRIDLPLLANAQ